MRIDDLHHLRVLVTRPKPQGDLLCAEIAASGGQPVYLPTIQIAPPLAPHFLHEQIQQLDKWDWLIFISPQAVWQCIPLIRECWSVFPEKIKIAAVGEGTANALYAEGFKEIVYSAHEWSSEGLFKTPLLSSCVRQANCSRLW